MIADACMRKVVCTGALLLGLTYDTLSQTGQSNVLSDAEKLQFGRIATTLCQEIRGLHVQRAVWIVEPYRKGSMVGVKHPQASFGFDRSGLLRSFWSGGIGERMRRGAKPVSGKPSADAWYRPATELAKKLWPGLSLVRRKVGYTPEIRSGTGRGWESWSNTASVTFEATLAKGTPRGLNMIFDLASGECLAITLSLPFPAKPPPGRRARPPG